jgi:hypothetical protein
LLHFRKCVRKRCLCTKAVTAFVNASRKQIFTKLDLFGIGYLIGLNTVAATNIKKVSVSKSVFVSRKGKDRLYESFCFDDFDFIECILFATVRDISCDLFRLVKITNPQQNESRPFRPIDHWYLYSSLDKPSGTKSATMTTIR